MSEYCHYIIVRRDLPLGIMAAMITHAAGESASHRLWPLPEHTKAIVLEAKNEEDLIGIRSYLAQRGIPLSYITEYGGVYDGRGMAIGVHPCVRDNVRDLLSHLPLLRDHSGLDNYDDQC